MELGVMFLPGHDMSTSPINIPFTCWIVLTLSVIKHSTGQNVKVEIEEQEKYLDSNSRLQIKVTATVWDDSRQKEMDEMKQWNKELATSIDRLWLLECNMPLIQLFKNMTHFSHVFETYLTGEKIELERLRGEREVLESEKISLKETVAVESMNAEECRSKFEKASKELILVHNERHMIRIQYTKLEKELEAEKNKTRRLRKDMEYMKNEIEDKNDKLRKFLSMEPGLDIFVTWRTSINAVMLDVRNKHEEQMRNIRAMYEKKKASEIFSTQVKIRETLVKEGNNYTNEINSLREQVSLLDRQLENKERYKQAIAMEYDVYRESSQKRIRELENELSSVMVVIGRFRTDEISLQSELDTYGMLQEELKQIISNVNSCSETMNINERLQKIRLGDRPGTEDKNKSSSTIKETGPAETTVRDGSTVAKKKQPLESTDETRPAETTVRDGSTVAEKTQPLESMDETRPAETTVRDGSTVAENKQPLESTDETRPAETTVRDGSTVAEKTQPMESMDETSMGPAETTVRDGSALAEKTQPSESTDETRPAETPVRDGSTVAEKTQPMESMDETSMGPAETTVRDGSTVAEKTQPLESMDETNAGKVDDSITATLPNVEQTSDRGTS